MIESHHLPQLLKETKDLYYKGYLQSALDTFSQNKLKFTNDLIHPLDKVKFLLEYGKLLVINIRNYQPAEKAISLAGFGDAVVFTGKGSESFINIAGGKKIPWNEKEIVEKAISNL